MSSDAGELALAVTGADRPVVMGVLNVTPDSFSDGGRWLDADAAVARGRYLAASGADIVDVGGESNRPGARRIAEAEELRRVVPVVEALAAGGVPVSVDTMRSGVAERAVGAGAVLVNDVTGGLGDPAMLGVVAGLEVTYVAMHWRGPADVMDQLANYDDVVVEVVDELRRRVDAALAAGITGDRIVVDPGIGFAKNADHNWAVLRRLDALVAIGQPVLVGASRKRFLGALLAGRDGEPVGTDARDAATAAISALAAAAGVWGVRVHEPAASLDAVKVGAAWRAGS